MINIKYTNGIFGGGRIMGKEEIGKQIDSKKFSKTEMTNLEILLKKYTMTV